MIFLLPISFEAIRWQQLPIAQFLSKPTASLLDHGRSPQYEALD